MIPRILRDTLTALLFVLTFCPLGVGQNLIVNPGFEDPPISGQFLESVRLPGWTITGANGLGELQHGADGLVAGEGRQWIELDTTGNTTISQNIPTVQGRWYRFQYLISKRPGQSGNSFFDIFWNGQYKGTATASTTTWERWGDAYQATGPTTTIAIAGKGTSDSVGDLLDSVEVIPVDDPNDTFGYNYYLPQIVSGGDWRTSVTITTADASSYSAPCWKETWYNQNGTQRNFAEGCMAAGSTRSRDVPGATSPLAVGWTRIRTTAPARILAIYQEQNLGFNASVIAREAARRIVAPFDQRNNYRTGIAVANPGSSRIYLRVTIRNASGTVRRVDTGRLFIEPNSQMAFFLDEQWTESRAIEGQIEIQAESSSGSPALCVVMGLRFAPNGAFTTLPF